jgi:alpha/beta superfamily hydrolase
VPEQASRRSIIYCCDGGIESIGAEREALLRTLAARGIAIYIADLRGIGETRSRGFAPGDQGERAATWLSNYLRMLGTSLGALRAYDLRRVADYVRSREGAAPVGLWADGFVGWAVAIAAVLDGNIDRLCFESMPPNAVQHATKWTLSPPEAYTIPGLLRIGDIPDFVAASGALTLAISEMLDSVTANAEIADFWSGQDA